MVVEGLGLCLSRAQVGCQAPVNMGFVQHLAGTDPAEGRKEPG